MYRTAIAQLRKVTSGYLLAGKPLAITALAGTIALTASSGTARYQTDQSNVTWSIPLSGVATAVNSGFVVGLVAGFAATCNDVTAKVSAKRGTGLSGHALVSVTDVNFANGSCTTPEGVDLSITAATLPWSFNARAYDAGTGTTTGRLSGITVNVQSSQGCRFTATGSSGDLGEVDATYQNSTGQIQITDLGHMRVTDVGGGCPFQKYEEVLLSAQFSLIPRGIITSP